MNEVEKKEIEEMARTMGKCKKYKNCEDCIEAYKKVLGKKAKLKDCELYCEATTLYNAGYGKVDDYKKEIARLKEKTSFIITARQDGKSSQVRNYICKIEQQVIKEFCERLKLDFTPYIVRDFATNCEINPNLVIDDLLKEYGIGEE